MKYIVYLTTNNLSEINGMKRIYVGIHRTNDPTIFDGYIGGGVYINQSNTYLNPKTPFQYAVKKYGTKSFKRTILFVFDSLEEAYKTESVIVNDDFVKQDHVYNVKYELFYQNKPIYQFDNNGSLLKKWESELDIQDFFGCSLQKLDYAIQNKYKFLGFYWAITDSIDVSFYLNKNTKAIYLYSKNGKLLREFPTKSDCENFLGINNITKLISNQVLVNDLYFVSDKLVDIFILKPRVSLRKQKFYVYNESGEFIGAFIGKKVMSVINLHSWKKINNIFKCNNNWYKNFYLSFEEVKKVPEKVKNNVKIDVFTNYGEFIETLNSVKEVKEKYNVPASKIKNIQKGNKYFENWIFKYHTNKIVEDIV